VFVAYSRALDVYQTMSDEDCCDYEKLTAALRGAQTGGIPVKIL